MDHELQERAEAWLTQDPDPVTREELQSLIDADDPAALEERFSVGSSSALPACGEHWEQAPSA